MNEKILIFGLGVSGRAIYRKLKDQNIIGFVDNNKDLEGTTFDGIPIYSLSKLEIISFDKIALGGVWINSMIMQLKNDYQIKDEQLLLIADGDVEFSSIIRAENTDLIVKNIYNITKKESMNCYVIGSSLATLFRNKDLSSVADVDVFLTSQEEAVLFFEQLVNSSFFRNHLITKVLYEKDEVFVKKDYIKKIVIQSQSNKSEDEPAIVDISIANDFKENYFVRHGENYIYIPKELCEGYRFFDYKNIEVQIPKFAEKYLDLLYGVGWIVPPKKWDQSDYGNLMTNEEVISLKAQVND